MDKFKVGDIVKGTDSNRYAITNDKMTKGKVVERLSDGVFSVEVLEHKNSKYIGETYPWLEDEFFELVEEKFHPIVIYRNGNEVIALDKNTGEKGIAKCNPADKFDFYVGAQLAYDRLIKGKNDEKKEKKKLLNCKFCVTATEQPCFTVGKIYEIIDGCFRCEDGTFPLGEPIEDVDDLKDYLSGKPGSRRNGDIGWMHKTEFVVVVE